MIKLLIMYSSLFAIYSPSNYSKNEQITESPIILNSDNLVKPPEVDDIISISDILPPLFEDPIKFEEPTFKDTLNLIRGSKEPKQKEYKGSKQFEEAFKKAVEINPEVLDYKEFLVRTAKRESGFNSRIQNTTGAPYYGYFLMGKNEIKVTTGLTVELFRNDPVKLILGAIKLYKLNLRTLKNLGVYEIGKLKGYSDDALISGTWLAGAGGVKKFLLKNIDSSDSHWYKNNKGGTSVSKIMNNWMNGN